MPAGTSLPQEIPALVEADLQVSEPLVLVCGSFFTARLVQQGVLFRYESFDALEDFAVLHAGVPFFFAV